MDDMEILDDLDPAEREFIEIMRENEVDLDLTISRRDGQWTVRMTAEGGHALPGSGHGKSFARAWEDLQQFAGPVAENIVGLKPRR